MFIQAPWQAKSHTTDKPSNSWLGILGLELGLQQSQLTTTLETDGFGSRYGGDGQNDGMRIGSGHSPVLNPIQFPFLKPELHALLGMPVMTRGPALKGQRSMAIGVGSAQQQPASQSLQPSGLER
jgi:hypothetical protein